MSEAVKGVVWCLFDGSGIMGLPWAEAGYQVYCFNASSGDHGEYFVKMTHPNITFVDTWIDRTFDPTGMGVAGGDTPSLIVGFPPCTMLAGCGEQHERTEEQIQEALENVRIVETLGNKHGVPWMIENPVGKLSTMWRKPNHYFHPWEYGGHLKEEEGSYHPKMPVCDGYTKKTCIWCGNGFIMPPKHPAKEYQNWFWGWKSLGGDSPKTKQLRSLTPRGFARAVFKANGGQHEREETGSISS
ncbi:hypothetical protein [Citrobacter phage Tr1]|nr:hypothetical protein [Citrobacter phage Tr1]